MSGPGVTNFPIGAAAAPLWLHFCFCSFSLSSRSFSFPAVQVLRFALCWATGSPALSGVGQRSLALP